MKQKKSCEERIRAMQIATLVLLSVATVANAASVVCRLLMR